MASRQAVLGMEQASFYHGAVRVFEGVSFLLDDAKTALGGENGAGKSTLLKCLAGELERPPILRRKQCVYRLDYSYT
jgi:ABC-type sugar transport system ATPase subunit